VAEAVMRFTVVDERGTLSFVGPGYALKMLAAGCARQPVDALALLRQVEALDGRFAGGVLAGLAVFDEHNTPDDHSAIHRRLDETARDVTPPFRVVDEATRRWSLEPARAGLVVFNLPARRIVQIQNTYGELSRSGVGRIRDNGKPTRQLYRYELPSDWTILP
jgi:hypothetical protein